MPSVLCADPWPPPVASQHETAVQRAAWPPPVSFPPDGAHQSFSSHWLLREAHPSRHHPRCHPHPPFQFHRYCSLQNHLCYDCQLSLDLSLQNSLPSFQNAYRRLQNSHLPPLQAVEVWWFFDGACQLSFWPVPAAFFFPPGAERRRHQQPGGFLLQLLLAPSWPSLSRHWLLKPFLVAWSCWAFFALYTALC